MSWKVRSSLEKKSTWDCEGTDRKIRGTFWYKNPINDQN